jgi:hypothetical protein
MLFTNGDVHAVTIVETYHEPTKGSSLVRSRRRFPFRFTAPMAVKIVVTVAAANVQTCIVG